MLRITSTTHKTKWSIKYVLPECFVFNARKTNETTTCCMLFLRQSDFRSGITVILELQNDNFPTVQSGNFPNLMPGKLLLFKRWGRLLTYAFCMHRWAFKYIFWGKSEHERKEYRVVCFQPKRHHLDPWLRWMRCVTDMYMRAKLEIPVADFQNGIWRKETNINNIGTKLASLRFGGEFPTFAFTQTPNYCFTSKGEGCSQIMFSYLKINK